MLLKHDVQGVDHSLGLLETASGDSVEVQRYGWGSDIAKNGCDEWVRILTILHVRSYEAIFYLNIEPNALGIILL